MKKPAGFLGLVLLMICCFLIRGKVSKTPKRLEAPRKEVLEKSSMREKETGQVKLTIVYDNNLYDERLGTGWGFGCLVEAFGKNILFDTGADSPTLLANMETLGIDPKEIDILVLSHIHGDHVGGIWGVLEANSKVTVFLPQSFPASFKEKIKSYGADFVDIFGPTEIGSAVFSTGELGEGIEEQSLVVKTKRGLVIITGCAHPGVVNIVKKAKELFGEKIYLVLGGFHLGGVSDSEILGIIKDLKALGVQKSAPCHCSGDRARELFGKEFGDNYLEVGVGKEIRL